MWTFIKADKPEWDKYWLEIEKTNLIQSWEYGEVKHKAENWQPLRFIIKDESGRARWLIQILAKKVPVFGGVARVNRGPLVIGAQSDRDSLNELSPALFALLRMACSERWWYLSIAPEIQLGNDTVKMMRQLGFRPGRGVPGGSSVISLEQSEEELFNNLKGKWRNILRKAQRFGTHIETSKTSNDIDMMVKYYEEMQRCLKFKGIPSGIIRYLAIQNSPQFDFSLFWAKEQNDSRVVGFLATVGHGNSCTYLLSWTSPEGRELQTNYLLLWHALLMSKRKGYRWFDLGGHNKNTPSGIAHFKEGLGGASYNLIGEWRYFIPFRKSART